MLACALARGYPLASANVSLSQPAEVPFSKDVRVAALLNKLWLDVWQADASMSPDLKIMPNSRSASLRAVLVERCAEPSLLRIQCGWAFIPSEADIGAGLSACMNNFHSFVLISLLSLFGNQGTVSRPWVTGD